MLSSKAMMGAPSAEPLFVESVFSTYLYTGNGSTQTITNGIDLSGEGGLVWLKRRDGIGLHGLFDTNRGATNWLRTNATNAQTVGATTLTSFNNNGFTLGSDVDLLGFNVNTAAEVSWTFRKAPKFFDVVTYTGTGANRTIAHNLGSVPGMIIVKRTDTSSDWQVYHRSLANTQYMVLDTTAAVATGATRWNSTTPTASVFSLGTDATVNASGGTYVAYLFAHDAGGFGAAGDQNVVSCGSFTTDGNAAATVNLGYEPQYVLTRATSGGAWVIQDVMRGFSLTQANYLRAQLTSAEINVSGQYIFPTATGFSSLGSWFDPSTTYIYLAIRRGPMKTPTVGTSVFSPITNSNSTGSVNTTGFPVDLQISTTRSIALNKMWVDRLRGASSTETESGQYLYSNVTSAEASGGVSRLWNNTGFQTRSGLTGLNVIYWSFRRAPGFFDEVCYTGTGSARTVNHNLGVVPELIIVKKRSGDARWQIGANTLGWTDTSYLNFDTGAVNQFGAQPVWNNTAPTTTNFSVATFDWSNVESATYVAYLFATVPNVSKVGSYTGTGGTQTINAGLPTGARFVLIKRTNSTGNWWVWDTARGMVAGTDPRLALNTTAAEVNNNWVYTIANGFQIVTTDATINASGGSYIYLAIA